MRTIVCLETQHGNITQKCVYRRIENTKMTPVTVAIYVFQCVCIMLHCVMALTSFVFQHYHFIYQIYHFIPQICHLVL